MRSIFRMWEFWLNYAVILLVLLPVPVMKMRYVVTMNGQDIPQEPQPRTVWECYKFAQIEGLENPWNLVAVAMHWLVPFILMVLIWSLLVRRKNTSDEEDGDTLNNIVNDAVDVIDYD